MALVAVAGAAWLILLVLAGTRPPLFAPALARSSAPPTTRPSPPAGEELAAPAPPPAPAPAPEPPAAPEPPPPPPPQKLWPAAGPISGVFGESRGDHPHDGIDLLGPTGEPIVAAEPGTVVRTGWESGYGMIVVVDHGGGLETRYAHLSGIAVAPGQPVREGDVVGAMGSTGHSTGVHLHFEVRVNGAAVDPLTWLPAR